MREVKNKVEIGNIQKTGFKKEVSKEVEPQFCGDLETAKVQDFSNPSEVLGRSQVVNKTDNLQADVTFCSKHPSAVGNSDKLFEIAFKGLQESGDPEAYEKACSIVTCEDAKTLLK